MEYMRTHLKIEEGFIESMGPIKVERIPFGPKARYRHEALVQFKTVEARDAVRGAAVNLAGKGSEVGIRLEIPNRLRSSMKALQSLSFDIKTKHTTARRNILFDDESMDLVLDFSLGEGQAWRRVSSAQAKEKMKRRGGAQPGNMRINDSELDDVLGGAE